MKQRNVIFVILTRNEVSVAVCDVLDYPLT